MTIRTGVITFDGNAQLLSTILSAGVTDVPVYAVDIQAESTNGAVFHVGPPTVTAATGIRVPAPDAAIPAPPYRIGDFGRPALRLGDIAVIGTAGQKARVLVYA